MLDRVDRILVASHNADATANRWCELVDAKIDRKDTVTALGCKRIVLRMADAELEILEPTESGPVADHLAHGGGPFAGGMSSLDTPALYAHIASLGMTGTDLGNGQLYLDGASMGIPGLRLVLSPAAAHDAVGLLDTLYECTHLTADANQSTAAIARTFALDTTQFVQISSDTYGYEGALTLYNNSKLQRIETIHAYDKTKTMGRFFGRFGPSMYMCYAETADLRPLQQRLQDLAPGDWTGETANQDGMFIHPRATGTTMMGVSRTTYAWTWSGYPDRVKPL